MSWLGQIRTHRRDEAWSTILWQTFFVMTMGDQIPVIVEKPLAVYLSVLIHMFTPLHDRHGVFSSQLKSRGREHYRQGYSIPY
jgi:hypothetical protein